MHKNFLKLYILLIFFGCKDNSKSVNANIDQVDTNVSEKVVQTSEWIKLFDGSSLDYWRGYLKDDMPDEWVIEDGVLVFTPSEDGGKNIITKDKFKNFKLSLEWKISKGGNSGIFWGVYEDEKYSEAYHTGPEIQILDNAQHPDAKINPKFHQAGSLYDLVQPQHDVCKPAGEWNLCELEVNHKTNKGSVVLNGTKIASFPLSGSEWEELIKHSKFKDWEGFGEHHIGHIGLQDHGDKVWFRNIKIKRL
ncbi:DUF1080 domain-containing protein [Seonamhaeicola sediminis]|uniref:DUF1080 domain-containing protein n=1 Tax=Seonamhaeicola sediminis TaxID=2528206 RepID=A0A562YG48_9FLAO|nr:DUF1080 domain-containing protein [Seonamhaeicola sediminis]TWO33355.1 DUF1080 domain-containing protein [Seonamhaeicola sediminis]